VVLDTLPMFVNKSRRYWGN